MNPELASSRISEALKETELEEENGTESLNEEESKERMKKLFTSFGLDYA